MRSPRSSASSSTNSPPVAPTYRWFFPCVALGTLFGPTLAGYAFDVSGSYALPIAGGASANLIAVVCIVLIAEPSRFRAIARA